MVLLFNRSLVGGVLYVTRIPLFWLDDISMTSPALLNDCLPFGILLLLNNCWKFSAILLLNKQWRFDALLLPNKQWRFGNPVLLNICWQFWCYFIAKCTLAIWRHCIAEHTLAIFTTSYCLNRNNRVSSFYWTRGSKLCFLTCFSYFSCYFLILVFSQNCYSLISLHLPWLHRNLISCPIFLYLWHSKLVRCTCSPIFPAQNAWVS
jgi:hypothetical protein